MWFSQRNQPFLSSCIHSIGPFWPLVCSVRHTDRYTFHWDILALLSSSVRRWYLLLPINWWLTILRFFFFFLKLFLIEFSKMFSAGGWSLAWFQRYSFFNVSSLAYHFCPTVRVLRFPWTGGKKTTLFRFHVPKCLRMQRNAYLTS